ncbi:MAG: type I restriction enzyme HsdR N-terminal domain-containing protein [Bacteroidetes bacterium]|nr:type I restriction enzyme HsdR N-terminal domain-containing protein [Bacteroidota bacterium]
MQLNFKVYKFNLKNQNGNAQIFDIIRKKYVALTPEEWVRQHVIWYLKEELNISKGLIAVEKELKYNNLTKRFDLVVMNPLAEPLLLVECKAPSEAINQSTVQQAGIYLKTIKAPYVMLTNGLTHIYLQLNTENMQYEFIKDLPELR